MEAEQQTHEPTPGTHTPDGPGVDRSAMVEFGYGELFALVVLGLALTTAQRIVRRMRHWRRRIGNA